VAVSTVAGLLLLAAFVWVEARSRAPMMPLALFRSPTFAGVNLLTLLLYAALAGAFFFLPFALIQVHGYSATLAGTVFLPFTIIMAVLSRWSGGLLDRYGARLPLIVGPAIAAVGFELFAVAGPESSYVAGFLVPTIVLGLGMAVTVAPLTTSVINAVAPRQAGVASGINNAVSSVANLFAIALLGAIALGAFNHALGQRLENESLSPAARQQIEAARGEFATESGSATATGGDQAAAATIVRESIAGSIRLVMEIAAALALAGALCAALMIPGRTNDRAPKPET